MKFTPSPSLYAALCTAALLLSSSPATATTRVVAISSDQCPADQVTTPCYFSLQAALTNALSGDSIEMRPGIHNVANVVMNQNVSISGDETARTILNGGGAGTILTISGVISSVSIRNLTFFSANVGIAVQNSTPSVDIRNNIFEVGTGSTAISILSSPNTRVFNNTFYLNLNGIVSTTDLALNIFNNIFYQGAGSTAITPSSMSLTYIKNNLFYLGNIGPAVLTVKTIPLSLDSNFLDVNWKGNISELDPQFVSISSGDITQRDFHLLASSPCITSGDTTMGTNNVGDTSRIDIGAYGGQSDRIPFIVSGVSGVASASTGSVTDSITLTWSANNAYTTKGYNVYYGKASSNYNGNDAVVSGVTRTSPIDAGTSTSVVLTGLITSAAIPSAPHLYAPEPRNGTLSLSWSVVPGATSYNIFHSIASAPSLTFPPITVTNATSYKLSGLTNGELYIIAVTAEVQSPYYLAVTAYDSTSTAGTPGDHDESNYSAEQIVYVGTAAISGSSNIVEGIPEMLVPYPNLPNTGCFIATAAYGSENAAAVRILREFRDLYLQTNAEGRAFVRWYYSFSPPAARFITEHPALKPFVRAALAPAVAVAIICTQASPLALAVAAVLLVALMVYLTYRKRSLSSRLCTGNK
jgi:hypothetical protein